MTLPVEVAYPKDRFESSTVFSVILPMFGAFDMMRSEVARRLGFIWWQDTLMSCQAQLILLCRTYACLGGHCHRSTGGYDAQVPTEFAMTTRLSPSMDLLFLLPSINT